MDVWAVGAEVGFAVVVGIELAVVIVLLTIVEVDGGTAVASSAAQLLLVEPVHDSVDWHCFSYCN